MRLIRVFAYFFREAFVSLGRGWKVSTLAVLTIAVSLFVGGVFLLLSDSLARLAGDWRRQARIVLYLEPDTSEEQTESLREAVAGAPWVDGISLVSGAEAEARFRRVFPSLESLFEGWDEDPLPPSFEVSFALEAASSPRFSAWIEALKTAPGVQMVDDDRDWLARLDTVVGIVRLLGLLLGSLLLVAAVFTIAAVVRLAAVLYRQEIQVMRLVGATELYIRGPFLAEGLVQGLLGGLVAAAGLFLAFAYIKSGGGHPLLGGLLTAEFPLTRYLTLLTGIGSAAGLLGAVLSLRRESLQG